jgi:hypothetical protein
MARDRKAEAARRDERARAEGYASYGQKYRAEKVGMTAGEYTATIAAKRGDDVARAVTSGRLLGGSRTRAGNVIAAVAGRRSAGEDVAANGAQLASQWSLMSRYSNSRRVSFTFETTTGEVIHYYSRGGISVGSLKAAVAAAGGWEEFVNEQFDQAAGDRYSEVEGGLGVVTVTLV